MSAGEFFDLVRPAFLILSALLSIYVLANAQRYGFRSLALIWALATFFLPLVAFPLYLLTRLSYFNRTREKHRTRPDSPIRVVTERFVLPFFFGATIFALIALSQYREYNAVDAHLARAQQARLAGDTRRTIREYKAALTLEDDAHTHKLLGIALFDGGDWAGALSEFRLAERGGEHDEVLPFRIAVVLDFLNQQNQAEVEYKKFLYGEACMSVSRDYRCDVAEKKLDQSTRELQ